ncbi:MAG: hypothetical protein JOZ33_10175 [Acidobacteriaceae bacterium]|nr:hypothetical protein [Acidobacteriaceae bacterium]
MEILGGWSSSLQKNHYPTLSQNLNRSHLTQIRNLSPSRLRHIHSSLSRHPNQIPNQIQNLNLNLIQNRIQIQTQIQTQNLHWRNPRPAN